MINSNDVISETRKPEYREPVIRRGGETGKEEMKAKKEKEEGRMAGRQQHQGHQEVKSYQRGERRRDRNRGNKDKKALRTSTKTEVTLTAVMCHS